MRCSMILALFLVACPLHARDKVDVLVMNNGDRLTCEIKSLSSGVLYVGLDYAQGTIQLDWSKVDHVESKQLFLVRTQSGQIYVGSLSMPKSEGARPMQIEIAPDAEPVSVGHTEVVGITQTSESFWRRLNGAINSGFTYAKANQTMQYTLGANAQYLRENWITGAEFTSTLSGNTGVKTSTHNDVQAYYRHLMRWNNWFYTGIGSFLQSTEQQIDLQSNVGGGIGRYLKNTNRATISTFAGFGYQKTKYSVIEAPSSSQNTAAAMVGVNAALFKFDKTNVSLAVSALPALNQPGRIYSTIHADYFVKFWSDFTWNLSFYGNWDNQPPLNFPGSDYGMTSGFGWHFGNYHSSGK